MALGRTKNGRRQRAATEDQQDSFEDQQAHEPDPELESYLAALSPEGNVETTGTGRRFGAAEVHQVRLPLMANEQLKELAARQGTSPGALIRDWVLDQLSRYESPGAAPAPAPPAPEPVLANQQQHAWPQEELTTRQPAQPEQQYSDDLYGAADPHAPADPYAAAAPYAGGPVPTAPYTAGRSRPVPRGGGYAHYDDRQTDTEITIPHAHRRY